MKINKSKSSIKKTTVIALCVIIVACLGYGIVAKSMNLWPFTSDAINAGENTSVIDKNDIKQKTANRDVDANDNESPAIDPDVEKRIEDGGNTGQGQSSASGTGISDTGGKDATKQSGGVSSKSGNITLYSPTANHKLSNSSLIKGSAKVQQVYYRISDNVHGMTGSGRLNVRDGLFSGKIAVSTSAEKGLLELYSLNGDGQEINNITIKVTY